MPAGTPSARARTPRHSGTCSAVARSGASSGQNYNTAQFGTIPHSSGQCLDNVGRWRRTMWNNGQDKPLDNVLPFARCSVHGGPLSRSVPADVTVTCAQRAQQPVQQPEMLRVDTCDLRQGYAWGRSPLFMVRNCSLYAIVCRVIVRRGIVRGPWHVGISRTAFCCVADWPIAQCSSDSMIGERLHW